MKASLVYWHKARLQGKYVLEMEIHKVPRSATYGGEIKYGLIFTDIRNGKKVLMDNHHPKGPHIHLDEKELPYHFIDEKKLIQDFKTRVLEHMGVKI